MTKKSTLPADHPKNYCPESGLSFLSKLDKRLVARQLLGHIDDYNLDNYKGHSPETALLFMKNEVHLSLTRGEPTVLALLYLSAVSDTIYHSTFLDCLQRWFGVGGSVLKWFTS